MKIVILFLLGVILHFTASSAIISGQVQVAPSGTKIYLCTPILFAANDRERVSGDSAIVSLNGSFRFTVEHTHFPAYVILKIKEADVFLWLFLEKSDSIFIKITASQNPDAKSTVSFTGSNAAGHDFFNAYNYYPAQKFEPLYHFFDSLQVGPTKQFVQRLTERINHPSLVLQRLFHAGNITAAYRDYTTKDITAILCFEALKLIDGTYRKKLPKLITDYDKDVIKHTLYEAYSPTDTILLRSVWGWLYANRYYMDIDGGFEALHHIRINKDPLLAQSKLFSYLKRSFDERVIETLWGEKLLSFSEIVYQSGSNLEEMLDELTVFIRKFPASPYATIFVKIKQKFSEKINQQSLRTENPMTGSPDILYMDTLFRIKALRDILGNFKGKFLYVDIWASWCRPCIEEFAQMQTIDSLQNQFPNLGRVYISLDNPVLKSNPLALIRRYHLKGHHILAGNELAADLRKKLAHGQPVLMLPRYLLIGPSGKILLPDAPRPSDAALKKILLRYL